LGTDAGERQMNEPPFTFGISYELPGRRETPAVIGAKLLDTLDALSRVDPLFADWIVPEKPTMTSWPLAVARPRIAKIVENNVVRDDYGQPEPKSGYGFITVTKNAIPSRIVKLLVRGGSPFRDELLLLIGDPLYPTDPAIVKYDLFRQALLATSMIWRPAWAVAAAVWLDSKEPMAPGGSQFPDSHFNFPWMAYLSPASSLRFALPADIRTERAPDGGLLMTTTEEPFDPRNPEHLRGARILAETMIARTGRSPIYNAD
jgi:Immunity protein 52